MANHMTQADMRRMMALNMKSGWAFSKDDLLKLLSNYIKAYIADDVRKMEMIEFRLEDANFHTECGHLADKEFTEYVEFVKEEYK